jgi:protein TonB
MAKDFDLTSQKWLDLVFEDKNKEYGAYVLREESSNRHLKSLLVVVATGLAVVFLPNLIKTVIPTRDVEIEQTATVDMTVLEQEIPEENQIKELENIPPPPQLKETVQFTPPVVRPDEEVTDDDLMLTQQDLTDNTATISVATVEGTADGVDIRDLQDHKVVVQDTRPQEIHSHVEQMPTFPGGNEEMLRFLANNIKYPVVDQERGIQGRVQLRFVVEPDGSIGAVEIVRSVSPTIDAEAVRVVKNMPKFIPGRQNGIPVRVYFSLPVMFRLSD